MSNKTTIIGVTGLSKSGKDTFGDYLLRLDTNARKYSFADPIKHFCKEVFDWSDETLWSNSEFRNKMDIRGSWVIPTDNWFCRFCDKHNIHLPNRRNPHKYWEEAQTRFINAQGAFIDLIRPRAKWDGYMRDFASESLRDWFEDIKAQQHLVPRYALQSLGTEFGRNIDENLWVRTTLNLIEQDNPSYAIVSDVRFLNEAAMARSSSNGQFNKGYLVRVTRPTVKGLEGKYALHPSERFIHSDDMTKFVNYEIFNNKDLENLKLQAKKTLILISLCPPNQVPSELQYPTILAP